MKFAKSCGPESPGRGDFVSPFCWQAQVWQYDMGLSENVGLIFPIKTI